MKLELTAIAAAALLTGCSHNIGTAFSGKLVNLGYDPEMHKLGVQYYDGVMVTGVNRENSEQSLTFESGGTASGGEQTSGETTQKLTYSTKVGKQITGYYVDALKQGATPEQLEEYTKQNKGE